MFHCRMGGNAVCIGLTDVGITSERDREADNVSRLVYICVSFVTAEQSNISHKRRKQEEKREIKIIKRGAVQMFARAVFWTS